MKPETVAKQNTRKCPLVTVDIIIEILDWYPKVFKTDKEDRRDGIVIIKRGHEPLGFALPGGFVDIGECTIDAAIREAKEETGLDITDVQQFHTYSAPERDARGHAITVVYTAKAMGYPHAGDDAKEAFIGDLENANYDTKMLCFDHKQIITDYLIFKRTGRRPTRE